MIVDEEGTQEHWGKNLYIIYERYNVYYLSISSFARSMFSRKTYLDVSATSTIAGVAVRPYRHQPCGHENAASMYTMDAAEGGSRDLALVNAHTAVGDRLTVRATEGYDARKQAVGGEIQAPGRKRHQRGGVGNSATSLLAVSRK